jgi:hypothetical protein
MGKNISKDVFRPFFSIWCNYSTYNTWIRILASQNTDQDTAAKLNTDQIHTIPNSVADPKPDPLVLGTDQDPAPDPSIIKQK